MCQRSDHQMHAGQHLLWRCTTVFPPTPRRIAGSGVVCGTQYCSLSMTGDSQWCKSANSSVFYSDY